MWDEKDMVKRSRRLVRVLRLADFAAPDAWDSFLME